MRILWANFYCLLDTSSGASMSVRQILAELKRLGHDVRVLGATVFDSPKGVSLFGKDWPKIEVTVPEGFIDVNDRDITHILMKTRSTERAELTHSEQGTWVARFRHELRYFKPEFLFFYGGGPGDFIPSEARAWNVPCGAYLVNGTFDGHRWCRDIDTFITDTCATRDYYREKLNIDPFPIGKFIEREKIAQHRVPETLLYVNPSLSKGAVIVVMMARLLQKMGSSIKIEVVESRGDWDLVLRAVNKTLGLPEDECPANIRVTPNTADMAAVYARAKVLFVPSLWWESGARVIAEAQLNGIPVVATHRGGNPEMVGSGGVTFTLPESCYAKPYLTTPTEDGLIPIAQKIMEIFSDESYYAQLSNSAKANARLIADAASNAKKLEGHIAEIVRKKAPWKAVRRVEPAYTPYDPERRFSEEFLYEPLEEGQKGIFLDCGGYDGCSAIKFILDNPAFECITFEPNPALWHYYTQVPTTLVKKGVAGAEGVRRFTLDDLDADGSSFVPEKRIDFRGRVGNENFRAIDVECVDLSAVIGRLSCYDKIVLKLDIEGAEYEVLERLLSTGTLSSVSKLYVEWHWQKCGMSLEQHVRLVNRVKCACPIEEWDALDMAIHNRDAERAKARSDLTRHVLRRPLEEYQKMRLEGIDG